MYAVLANLNNEFQLSIPEGLLLTKNKPELDIQKPFYVPLVFNNPIGPREKNIITHNSSGFRQFFLSVFFPLPGFSDGQYSRLVSSDANFVITHIIL